MDDGRVVGGSERGDIRTKNEQLVNGLSIPRLKHIGEKPGQKMDNKKTGHDKSGRDLEFSTCGQW